MLREIGIVNIYDFVDEKEMIKTLEDAGYVLIKQCLKGKYLIAIRAKEK